MSDLLSVMDVRPACYATAPDRHPPYLLSGVQVQVLCDVIASQPTVMMSTMDAIVRANAVAEASNTIFYRRLQLYGGSSPPGSVPELLRLSQQAVITCTSM
jgi:hypothetical protein